MFDKSQIPGSYDESQWFSNEQLESTSTDWRPSFNTGWLMLCYVSHEQINSLKSNFSSTSELSGINNIKYLGDATQPGEEGCGNGATYLPIYWQFNDAEPVLTLYFLSSEHISHLKQTDIHQANLISNTYYGPGKIMCFSRGLTV